MKLTMSWLRDHLDTDATLEEIAARLNMIGLEVEGIDDPARAFGAFTVARVLEAKPHPDADKLQVCMVETGDGRVQVVCGAANARAGLKGVFAPAGAHIPGTGLDLKKTKIRGVESNGMLLSERELGLSDEHEGIIELADDAPLGVPVARIMGLDDPVLDLAITANRPDALGVHGIARDLAAAGLGALADGRVKPVAGAFPCPVDVTIELGGKDAKNCPAFALRLVRGVVNGPSPAWMQRRLRAIGLRPINALVDITNYITIDRGRPLHVFDAAKVRSNLAVRMARSGEELVALDGRTYALEPAMTVIADGAGVESIAGVMGGAATGCTGATTDVLIESALWDPVNIARTGRALGLESDARHRFERGVDPEFMVPGLQLATSMVLELCGGEASEIIVAGEVPQVQHGIDFSPSEVKRLAGFDVPVPEIRHILGKLGFWVTGSGDQLKVAPPSWRPDISEGACLVEEVVRMAGTDRLPSTPLPRLSAVTRPVLTTSQKRSRIARRVLAGRGMVEAVTWSFVSEPHARAFGGGKPELALVNPISSEMSTMRPGLLAGLVSAARRNADRGMPDIALFEVGQAYRGIAPEDQYLAASGVRRGTQRVGGSGRDWREAPRQADVFDAKADALGVLAALGVDPGKCQASADAPSWFHPGRSGVLRLGPKVTLAHFGEIHPRSLRALDADGPVAAFEVFLDAIPEARHKASRARGPLDASDLMPVTRDFAFVVDEALAADELIRAARGADRALISDVRLFDVYAGEHVGRGKKSLAIEVTLSPRDKTLTDEEIDAVAARVVAQVEKATGGHLRG